MCLRGPSAGVNDENLASLTLMFLMSMQHLNLAPCRAPICFAAILVLFGRIAANVGGCGLS